MPPETRDKEDPQQPAAPGWLAAHRWLALAAAVGGMLAIGVVATVAVVWATRPPPEKPVSLAETLAALDAKDYVQARQLAEKLQRQGNLSMEDWGGPVFVLGVVADHEAQIAPEREQAESYLLAARWLEEAQNRGFPPGRQSQGVYLLGKCLALAGRYGPARGTLEAALKTGAGATSQLYCLLATCYAEDAKPDLAKALAENALYLADKTLAPADRQEGLLVRAGYLFRLHRTAECLAALDQIPLAAGLRGRATLLRGQILYEEGQSLAAKPGATAEDRRGARRKWELAIEAFRLAQSRDTVSNLATRQAMYLTGLCLRDLGDRRGAAAQLERTAKLFAEYPEGLAAMLQEAELARQAKRDADALAAYRRVLTRITDPEHFHNPWIPLDRLRSCVLAAYRSYLEARNFQMALQLSRMFYPLLPQSEVLELTAAVHTRWAQALLVEAEHVSLEKGDWLAHLGRAQWRQAGGVWLRLAQLELTDRQYPERLWTSANAYFQGQDYRNAVRILRNYVKNEMRRRHPQALLTLGQALLAMDESEGALAAFEECVLDHPRDAAAYRARLLAAAIHAEKGRYQQAETLLQENLSGEHLTPDSKEWRDSLFAFGELLHAQGRYAEAARRLEEFVHRYGDASEALAARYLLADSYRQGGQALAEAAPASGGAAAVRRAAQALQLREKARTEYQGLLENLGSRDDRDLTAAQRAMLRNSQFAVGGLDFDLQEYDAAARAYTAAAGRFADTPASLEAYVRLAESYRRLGEPGKARGALERAKVALARLPKDIRFDETTNYDRRQWGEALAWLSSL
jgi:tetratricopeptide (TPR) repeat protein